MRAGSCHAAGCQGWSRRAHHAVDAVGPCALLHRRGKRASRFARCGVPSHNACRKTKRSRPTLTNPKVHTTDLAANPKVSADLCHAGEGPAAGAGHAAPSPCLAAPAMRGGQIFVAVGGRRGRGNRRGGQVFGAVGGRRSTFWCSALVAAVWSGSGRVSAHACRALYHDRFVEAFVVRALCEKGQRGRGGKERRNTEKEFEKNEIKRSRKDVGTTDERQMKDRW